MYSHWKRQHAAYQMMADGYGYLQHLHFGGKLGGGSCDGPCGPCGPRPSPLRAD